MYGVYIQKLPVRLHLINGELKAFAFLWYFIQHIILIPTIEYNGLYKQQTPSPYRVIQRQRSVNFRPCFRVIRSSRFSQVIELYKYFTLCIICVKVHLKGLFLDFSMSFSKSKYSCSKGLGTIGHRGHSRIPSLGKLVEGDYRDVWCY